MRNAGDRRHRAAGPQPQPSANGGASLFTPAYRVNHPEDAGVDAYQESQPLPGDADSWSDDAGWRFGDEPGWPGSSPVRDARTSNAVRGFPPAPGEPLPVYPPGPFAAWNQRDADSALDEPDKRADSSRQLAAASITPVEFDTDYSLPAIRDPVAYSAHSDGLSAESATGSQAGSQTARRTPPSRVGRRAADRRGTRQKPRSKARRQSVRYAVAAAALIIVAVALILVITAPGRSGPPAAGQSNSTHSPSASPSASRPPGKWGFIGLESTDIVPVSATELFPLSFTNAGIRFARVAATEGPHCRGALIGIGLQSAVRKAGCTQVVRATYTARAVSMMATIGVFNLKSAAKASTAATSAGASQFVAQLKSKKGPAYRIGQGTGIEVAAVEGHYLLLGWAEYTGLTAPKRHAQRLALDNFITVLIQHTASIALSYRLTNGQPMPAG